MFYILPVFHFVLLHTKPTRRSIETRAVGIMLILLVSRSASQVLFCLHQTSSTASFYRSHRARRHTVAAMQAVFLFITKGTSSCTIQFCGHTAAHDPQPIHASVMKYPLFLLFLTAESKACYLDRLFRQVRVFACTFIDMAVIEVLSLCSKEIKPILSPSIMSIAAVTDSPSSSTIATIVR